MSTSAVAFLDLAATHGPLRDDLVAAFGAALSESGFVGGPAVASFEQAFADYCSTRHAIGVGNGTDALELILRGLDIGAGAEVIVPANTFIATVEAVVNVGAVPRFADACPDTLLIDPRSVAGLLNERTAAVIPVHLYGQMAPMAELAEVCGQTPLIEDACQAHGAVRDGARAGSVGVAAAFSFYPGKNLGALGDGGAVTTQDDDLAGRIRSIADHGRAAQERYSYAHQGRNSRLDALQARFLEIKLRELDAWNQARRTAARGGEYRMSACASYSVG